MHLDKTAFKKQSFAEAANHKQHYERMSLKEQSESFRYLMSVAYGFVGKEWPQMDKTVFHRREHP